MEGNTEKKALQSSSWFAWENSWDLAAAFHCWQCPQSCTFPAERRQEHDCNRVLGCRDVTSGTTSPAWMWHPPTPFPFTSALFPARWRPHQAIGEILCAMGIEEASESALQEFFWGSKTWGRGTQRNSHQAQSNTSFHWNGQSPSLLACQASNKTYTV